MNPYINSFTPNGQWSWTFSWVCWLFLLTCLACYQSIVVAALPLSDTVLLDGVADTGGIWIFLLFPVFMKVLKRVSLKIEVLMYVSFHVSCYHVSLCLISKLLHFNLHVIFLGFVHLNQYVCNMSELISLSATCCQIVVSVCQFIWKLYWIVNAWCVVDDSDQHWYLNWIWWEFFFDFIIL